MERNNVVNTDGSIDWDKIGSFDTQLADIAINVKKFGAKGDGVTDDTISIQTAMDELINGGVLLIPEGTFIVSSINIPFDNITIMGSGIESTIIKSNGLVNQTPLYNIKGNVKLMNFTIDGNGKIMPTPTAGDGAFCLSVYNCSNIKIDNVKFKNSYNKQTAFDGVKDVYISRCIFESQLDTSHEQDGVHLYGGVNTTQNIVIDECKFLDHPRSGVYCDIDVQDVTIKNCNFNHSLASYIQGDGVTVQGYGDNITIDNNIFEHYYRSINLRCGVKGIKIINNKFKKILTYGIALSGTESIYDMLGGEVRFNLIKETVNANGVDRILLGKNIVIDNNTMDFATFGGIVNEPNSASAISISGFNSATKNSYISNVAISRLYIIGAELNIGRLIATVLGNNDILNKLILDGADIISGINSMMTSSTVNGANYVTIKNNKFRLLQSTSHIYAKNKLKFIDNEIIQYRKGLSTAMVTGLFCKYTECFGNITEESNITYLASLLPSITLPGGQYFFYNNSRIDGTVLNSYFEDNIPLLSVTRNSGGTWFQWLDTTGRLRIKNGLPITFTDGTLIGAQV